MSDFRAVWEASYLRRENHVFVVADEVARFVSRYLRKRIGLDEVIDVAPGTEGARVLDLGCGIGRALIYGTDMGLEMHGVDLSETAVETAIEWLRRRIGDDARLRVVAADARDLPWPDDFFAHAVSDSALDSMPFDVARESVSELARVVRTGGFVYVSLIWHDPETGADEVIVDGTHERGTVQSYFDAAKIDVLTQDAFELLQCQLVRMEDQLTGSVRGRWHVVMRRR